LLSSVIVIGRCHQLRAESGKLTAENGAKWRLWGDGGGLNEILGLAAAGKVKCFYGVKPLSELPTVFEQMYSGKLVRMIDVGVAIKEHRVKPSGNHSQTGRTVLKLF
jgi:hypothetical protein